MRAEARAWFMNDSSSCAIRALCAPSERDEVRAIRATARARSCRATTHDPVAHVHERVHDHSHEHEHDHDRARFTTGPSRGLRGRPDTHELRQVAAIVEFFTVNMYALASTPPAWATFRSTGHRGQRRDAQLTLGMGQ